MQRGGGGVGEEGVKEAMVWQTQAGSNARAARAEAVEQLKQRGWTHAQLTAPIPADQARPRPPSHPSPPLSRLSLVSRVALFHSLHGLGSRLLLCLFQSRLALSHRMVSLACNALFERCLAAWSEVAGKRDARRARQPDALTVPCVPLQKGDTPLHRFARSGDVTLIHLAITAGAPVDIQKVTAVPLAFPCLSFLPSATTEPPGHRLHGSTDRVCCCRKAARRLCI